MKPSTHTPRPIMQKAPTGFVTSVSLHMYQGSSPWMDFCEIWCWVLSWKVTKIKI